MKAVIDLMEKEDLLDKRYKMDTDNWYSSLTLLVPAGLTDQCPWYSPY